jgi:hypothetical protein
MRESLSALTVDGKDGKSLSKALEEGDMDWNDRLKLGDVAGALTSPLQKYVQRRYEMGSESKDETTKAKATEGLKKVQAKWEAATKTMESLADSVAAKQGSIGGTAGDTAVSVAGGTTAAGEGGGGTATKVPGPGKIVRRWTEWERVPLKDPDQPMLDKVTLAFVKDKLATLFPETVGSRTDATANTAVVGDAVPTTAGAG